MIRPTLTYPRFGCQFVQICLGKLFAQDGYFFKLRRKSVKQALFTYCGNGGKLAFAGVDTFVDVGGNAVALSVGVVTQASPDDDVFQLEFCRHGVDKIRCP